MTGLIESKIQNWPVLAASVDQWRREKKKVVFTNGCFDLLHYGHIHYLAEARSLGDVLIVGLNSDDSVRRLKGPQRPHKDQTSRQFILAALFFVDAVTLFEEDDPLALIQLVQPDILVKGGDWKPEEIIGSEVVLKRGGTVHSLKFVEGYSTTMLEEKIRNEK